MAAWATRIRGIIGLFDNRFRIFLFAFVMAADQHKHDRPLTSMLRVQEEWTKTDHAEAMQGTIVNLGHRQGAVQFSTNLF